MVFPHKYFFPYLNKDVFFDAYENGNYLDLELWKSDGTVQGTKLVKNINKSSDVFSGSAPSNLFSFNNLVFFNAQESFTQNSDGKYDYFLFVTNGNEEGTIKLIDKPLIQKTSFSIHNSKLYFSNGNQLWVSDGTKIGTKKVNDFKFEIKNLYLINNVLIIDIGSELHKVDSTSTNSVFLSDKITNREFVPSLDDQMNRSTTISNLNFVFFVKDAFGDDELWRTDGTNQGTIYLGKFSKPEGFISTGKSIIFKNTTFAKLKQDLWISDGTIVGTKLLKDPNGKDYVDINDFFTLPTKFKDKVYFTVHTSETPLFTNDLIMYKEDLKKTYKVGNDPLIAFMLLPKHSDEKEYLYSIPSNGGFLVKGLVANKDSINDIINLKIEGNRDVWVKKDNLFFFNRYDGLYIQSLCSHTAKINTPNGTSFCPGSSVSITGEGSGTTSPFTYKWKQGTTDAGIAATLAVTRAGTYTVEVTDKEGCTVSASVDITQTTNLPVSITGANSFCTGQTTTLTANATGGVSPYTYQWKQNSVNVGTNAITYAASAAGSYNVAVIDSKGCTGTSAAYSVTQKPSPNVTVSSSRTPTLLTGESVVLSVPTAAGQTYQWAKDGVAIAGATNNSYTVSGAGSYTVAVTGSGCTATSSAVMVSIILANEPLTEEIGLRVSPNPAINQAKIVLQLAQSASANVYVLDASGRRVRTWESGGKATRHEVMLDMRSVAAGNYVVQAEAEGQVFTEKLVKQ